MKKEKPKIVFVLSENLESHDREKLRQMVDAYESAVYRGEPLTVAEKSEIENGTFVVAKIGNELAGFINGNKEFSEIRCVYTAPKFRRIGIAERMVYAFRRIAQKKRITRITIYHQTAPIQKLHRKMASRPHYKARRNPKTGKIVWTEQELKGYHKNLRPAFPAYSKPTLFGKIKRTASRAARFPKRVLRQLKR